MHSTALLLIFGYIFTFLHSQVSSQNSGSCVDHGYTPVNGDRTPNAIPGYLYFPGAVIRYSCDEHYELQPNEPMQKCWTNQTSHLVWMPEGLPKCVELPVCSRPAISHAIFDKEVYHKGDRMNIACDKGYTEEASEPAVCLGNGKWSAMPSCRENDCPTPPLVENGSYSFYPPIYDVVATVAPGSIVFYYCDEGYKLETSIQEPRVCTKGEWTGNEPKCVKVGCDPPDPALGEYLPRREHYKVYDTVTYICHPDNDVIRSCQFDHTWSGTPCPKHFTTRQMPHTPSNVYCTTPSLPIVHGTYKCCVGDDVTASIAIEEPGFCCPERGLVEFVCDPGYSLVGDPTKWICGAEGEWLDIDVNHPTTILDPPKCYGNETRADQGISMEDMLKPVIGVAVGVLVALSVAIIIAFCRPKLMDMKRRWRKLREDEDELIIDGRRIILPSYDEAITSRDSQIYQQIASNGEARSQQSNPRDDAPGPSYFHPQSEPSSERFHPSCSSDEEMLVPELRGVRIERTNESRPQSLVLKAGTSVDSCVVINQTPELEFQADDNLKNEHVKDFMYGSMCLQPDLSVRDPAAAENVSSLLETESDDPMLDLGADSECDLGSIHPQTAPQPETRPVIIDGGCDMLDYPLIPVQCDRNQPQSFTVHIEPPEGSTSSLRDALESGADSSQPKDAAQSNCEESDEGNEQVQPAIPNSYHEMAVSSQTPKCQGWQDEMGSTTV